MPTETVDPSQTIEIHTSPKRLLGLFVIGSGMTAASAYLVWPGSPAGLSTASFGYFMGWLGVAFFGLCTIAMLSQFFRSSGPVIVLSPEGFYDRRLAPQTIPWPAIQRVGTWTFNRQKVLTFDIDPEFERTLDLRRMVRATRAANSRLGVDGLASTAVGLSCSYDELLTWVSTYARAHRSALA